MTDNSNTPTAANTQRTMYGILLLIGTTHLLNDMIQSLIPAIYPILKDSYDFSFSQIGIITLVFQLTSSLLQPFVGIYADRNPRPYMLAAGVIFTLIGLLCLSVSSTYAYILISVGLIGCGSSIFHPGASQVAQMASGGKKGLAQSIFQVGGNGGNAIGPLLAALIILPFGQSAIGWFAIATLLSFIILCYIGNWYRRQLRHSLHNVKVKAASATGLSKKQIKYALLILVILIFSKYFYFSCMTSYFTFFLIDKFSMSVQNSQLCLFAFLAASTIGTLAGGSIGDRYGRKLVILWSIFGAAPFALALPYLNLSLTMLFAVIIGLVISSAFSAIVVYATELMPGHVALIAGIFFGLMFGLGGLGSAFFGWLADLTSINFIFQVSTLLPLMGIIAAFLPKIKTDKA